MKKHIIISKRKGLYALALSIILVSTFLFSGGGSYNNFVGGAVQPVKGNYYFSDYYTKNEALEAGTALNEEIMGEGITLLKNEDNVLPLPKNSKISLFGKRSVNMIHSGSGSGTGSGGKMVYIQQALTDAGFDLNPTLLSFYNNNSLSGPGPGVAPSNPNISSGYNTGETPVSSYTTDITASYADYNAAALVIFSRIGGEGFDLPRTMSWNGSSYNTWSTDQLVPGARSKTDHYLQLDENEAALLKHCGENFSKVIVLLNTGSQFECGFLDDANHYGYHQNIKAALWIGYPGGTGLAALGKILNGEINPSGKTVDTYARDFKQDPAWKNFGNNLVWLGNQYVNLSGDTGGWGGGNFSNFVNYQEGIYVGYRYYETRGFTEKEAVLAENPSADAADQEAWYNNVIVYPFGYGLSYTTFSKTIQSRTPAENSVLAPDGTITVTVRVTNTGSAAGKEVVQLYYTSPYITNGIEKSHVVLGAFEKTRLLQPGEYEDVALSLKVQNMASYDFADKNNNGFKGYELDAGTYIVKVMNNSHEVAASVCYTVSENIKYENDGTTGNPVGNLFDDVSSQITTYLSRADFEGTFPTTSVNVSASTEIQNKLAEWRTNNPSDTEQPYYSSEMPVTGNNTGDIKLSDLAGLDYDDSLWDSFLNQFSVSGMRNFVGRGNYGSSAVSDLGVPAAINADGPSGWVNWSSGTGGSSYTNYSCETVLASTWNKELAYQKGVIMGNEGLFGNGSSDSKFPGWYAPAVNIHRSPFGGRNFEYYSEDGYLTGQMAAKVVAGAKTKGLFCYVKHFGINEQETNRVGLMTWASEQSMREIYLKGFELCVKEGGTVAVMSGLNRIGAVWAGGCYNLLTGVLRNEWGFKGAVVTDSFIGGYSNSNQMIRAGGDLVLGNSTPGLELESATTITCLRNSTHNLCYVLANSMAMNTGNPGLSQIITSYEGGMLIPGITGIAYTANLGTAILNEDENLDISLLRYSLKPGSALPAGLTLSEDGILSGIPGAEVNNYKFVVQATYQSAIKEAEFVITVIGSNSSIVYQMDRPLDTAFIGQAYNFNAGTAEIYKADALPDEVFPPITYAMKNASLLPDGLTLSNDGVISGTPLKECRDYGFSIVASADGFKDQEITVSITVLNGMTFSGKTLPDGKFGTAYLNKVMRAFNAGGKAVSYELKEGSILPLGLSLTKEGYIAGTPTEVVSDRVFTILAIADYSVTQEAEYKISIGLSFNDTTLPDGKKGGYYDASVDTAQGRGDITYALKEGSVLPEGLKLDSGGNLTGLPEAAGVYTLTVTASSAGILGDEVVLTLYIADEEPADNASGGCGGKIAGKGILFGGGIVLLTLGLCVLKSLKRKKRFGCKAPENLRSI